MELTYKEFFEKSKTEPRLQQLVGQCLMSALKVSQKATIIFPDSPKADVGKLILSTIKTMGQIEGFDLVGEEEIDAEYMGGILNSYGANMKPSVGPHEK